MRAKQCPQCKEKVRMDKVKFSIDCRGPEPKGAYFCHACGGELDLSEKRKISKAENLRIMEMLAMEHKALEIWRRVCSNCVEIDPDGRYVWEGIFIGVVLALGGTVDHAKTLYREKAFYMEQV